MGRKNRKGRSAKQNPRRFYRPKRTRDDDPFAGDDSIEPEAMQGGWTRRRGRRRRRSGAADAVDAIMDRARRHDRRELVRDDEPGPLWLVDAARVRSLPHPGGRTLDVVQPPPKAAICGNCREWVPPADPHAAERGRCVHPASGISHPPAEYEGCPFFA